MSVVTQTVWPIAENDFPVEKTTTLYGKIEELHSQGKVSLDPKVVVQSAPKMITQRTWVDAAAAQEWIDYVLSQGAESAEIVS